MAGFFAHARGSVKAVESPWQRVAAFRIRTSVNIPGPVILTQAAISQKGNYQFLHTLNDSIFVYVFGDRIGELLLSGMAFADGCDIGGEGHTPVLETYDAVKISTAAQPIIVNFGNKTFECLVTGMDMRVENAETMIGQWTFKLSSFPAID